MTWPTLLVERGGRVPDLDLCVIPGSTAVVAFGDPMVARVATVGMNPGATELRDGAGSLLAGDARRLATLKSLGLERYDQITDEHAAAIVDDCATYFDRRPSEAFDPLGEVVERPLGASYRVRSACHLNLVQWATSPGWGELPAEDQDELVRADVPFLKRLLRESPFEVVLVNGRSEMSALQRHGVVRWQLGESIDGPPTVQVSVGDAGTVRFIGWSCNLQTQQGARVHVDALAELVERYASAVPTRSPARTRRSAAKTAAAVSRDSEHGQHGDGPMARDLHFTSKSELVGYLASWLERSSHDTIGDIGTYGGSAWATIDSEAGTIGLNRDTTRQAVEELVASARNGLSYDWIVVENQKGRINKVQFCEDRTPGWFAYLTEPLAAEARLGHGMPRAAAVPAAPTQSPPRPAQDRALHRPIATPPAPIHTIDPALPRQAAVVQFPHPGGEHVPAGSSMGWNTGSHQRKFLISPGRYVDDLDGTPTDGGLVFWGEWEAQSRVIRRWPRRWGLPTVLHEPYWSPVETSGMRQNTDPWVFGDTFFYSNCKQHTNNTPTRQASALQSLPTGSMILFGSAFGGDFVVDTVVVIRDKAGQFRPVEDMRHLGVDAAFDTCTLQSLTTYEPHIGTSTYTLYRAARVDDPVHGMFSFVPSRLADGPSPRFARPAIHLPGIVNPASKQSPSGATATDRRPVENVVNAWQAVVDQVLSAGLSLGVQFATPPRR